MITPAWDARGRRKASGEPEGTALHVLVIDNYDSFTYNIVDYLARCGAEVTVMRNDAPLDPRRVLKQSSASLDAFDAVVISPGPGSPTIPSDLGISAAVLEHAEVPVLGICLGMQAMAYVEGGRVDKAPEPVHGREDVICVTSEDPLWEGIADSFTVVRYHSLMVTEVPRCMRVTARNAEGLVMALEHKTKPWWGVQFHPESIGSEHGEQLIGNFLAIAAQHTQEPRGRRAHTQGQENVRVAQTQSVAVYELAAPEEVEPVDIFVALGGQGALMEFEGKSIIAPYTSGETISGLEDIAQSMDSYPQVSIEPNNGVTPLALPGWFGYLGYEANHSDFGPQSQAQVPASGESIKMFFAERIVVIEQGRMQLVALVPQHDAGVRALVEWRNAVMTRIRAAAPVGKFDSAAVGRLHVRESRRKYLQSIAKIHDLIGQGSTYEVCLTTQLEAESDGDFDAPAAYKRLTEIAPAPMRSLLVLDGTHVVSSSPERFLKISQGIVSSEPIKGTRARYQDPEKDAEMRQDLATNKKDRAENLMIVDLVRNDLAHVCEPGSVRVDELCQVKTFARAHQLVSTISGKLKPSVTPAEVIRAAFPGGSMTGAPKYRTMEIIAKLEGHPRGVYSGAIGFITVDGSMDLAMTIRTAVVQKQRLSYGVGGAVIALSSADAEWDEIATKSAPLLSLVEQNFPHEELLEHDGTRLRPALQTAPPTVVDSFLLVDGHVRGFDSHCRRFRSSCLALQTAEEEEIDRFLAAVKRELPLHGKWFPRLESLPGGKMYVRFRPAPRRREATTLTTVILQRGQIQHPTLKGPDLAELIKIKNTVSTDDALLVSPRGIHETTTAALLAWKNNELVSMGTERLASVTEHAVRKIAQDLGYRVTQKTYDRAALDGVELWVVNALHGISRVSELDGEPLPCDAQRLEQFRSMLAGQQQPLIGEN
ncbi:aminodeoxychorismate synthase component I [Corynebacterium pseudotuberculosis]|uniref:aminodeoxychorismate synthase component I n=1 Tax=Corynebacterium pseudotuberculosis TaxID=1719 RepID=UPI000256B5EC|nr:aminodeoxychorismate synthase component I [Corynebacterium pseudotuberculosis]ADO26861.2 aminodeoxychorismate synthase component I [Corynebacterium pseudotuberculosis I19]AFF22751.1 Para-aminobenzoate synthase component I [Corynebacterium pseudotuberculosis P54B96]AKI59954.2 aminodeoxychorismate synthase component I [Corynebacterium pseudotuberculosis]ALF57981.1 aminobenzoate synthetase [Corynebacterium pseudotuberculosis]ALP34261.1 Para-aminobenzoate synthase component I [Corynebacterium p